MQFNNTKPTNTQMKLIIAQNWSWIYKSHLVITAVIIPHSETINIQRLVIFVCCTFFDVLVMEIKLIGLQFLLSQAILLNNTSALDWELPEVDYQTSDYLISCHNTGSQYFCFKNRNSCSHHSVKWNCQRKCDVRKKFYFHKQFLFQYKWIFSYLHGQQ